MLQVIKEIVEVERCEVPDLIGCGAVPRVDVDAPFGERDRPEQAVRNVPGIDRGYLSGIRA
jgi:hypothetical protein